MKKNSIHLSFIIFLLFFLYPKSSNACSCPPGPTWVQSYDHSEHIIIGLAIDENILRVVETFKGGYQVNDTITIEVNTSCGFNIKKKTICFSLFR